MLSLFAKLINIIFGKAEPPPETLPEPEKTSDPIIVTPKKEVVVSYIFPNKPVKIANAVCFTSGMQIDADGCPFAYAPMGNVPAGLDYLANAGHEGNWYGLVTVDGKPVIQGPNDPAPGFFVSPTALQDHFKDKKDPARYVDSDKVPYVVIPPEARNFGVYLGDVCMVLYKGKSCPAIVADLGPHNKYGEASMLCARLLGIPHSPKNGGVSTGVTYILFQGSSVGWPRSNDAISEQVLALFEKWKALQGA